MPLHALAIAAALTLPGPARLSPPLQLPGDASAASVQADRSTWIVGTRGGAAAARLARAAGGRAVMHNAYVVPRGRARALATALRRRGKLSFAEPNATQHLLQAPQRAVPDDPLSPQARWRDAVVDPTMLPPTVSPDSPLLALVDSKADVTHPEWTGDANFASLTGEEVTIEHGTATAAVAAAPSNDIGILGIWPGMRALNVPLPGENISCDAAVRGVLRALDAKAAVINMSYGSASPCYLEYRALQLATARGVTLVAAAGNEFDQGNPIEFPASLPHVLTIAALTPDDTAAFFSNENAAIDLGAPGVGILTAIPVALDTQDGNQDGYMALDGTSFAAPMVSAAAAWVRAARPDLKVDQVAQVIRLSARDIGRQGWDPSTGFGALDVAAALQKSPPAHDPDEPNEDIQFVDGSAFSKPDPPIWRGTKATTLFALLDQYEDPDDVYRIRVPAHRRVKLSVKPRFGNPDIEVYSGRAKRIGTDKYLIAQSLKPGSKTDTVRVVNNSGRTVTGYVRVFIRSGQRSLDAAYTLRIR